MKKFAWLLCAVAALFLAAHGYAVTYYVNASALGTTGSDSANGLTTTTPYLTLGKLVTVITTNDTAYLSGTFEESITLTTPSGESYRQWVGMPQAILRGDRTFNPVWSTSDAAGAAHSIKATLAGTNAVANVTYLWDTSLDVYGRHYGYLVNVATKELCESTQHSWCQVAGSNLLYVNYNNTTTAAPSGTIRWCIGTLNGIKFTGGATNCAVSGLHFYCFTDAANIAYAVKIEGAVGCTVEDCVAWDSGYHAFGTLNGASSGTIFRRCVSRGLSGGNSVGPTSFVAHATDPAKVNGVAFEDCYADPYTLLLTDGTVSTAATESAPTKACVGFFSHSDGTTQNVANLEYRHCTVRCWTGTSAPNRTPFGGTDAKVPTDPNIWSTYGVRLVDCVGLNGTSHTVSAYGSFAALRCSFNFSQQAAGGYALSGSIQTLAAAGATVYTLWQACEIIGNLDTNGVGLLLTQGHEARFYNSTLLDIGCNQSAVKQIVYYVSTTGDKLIARDSVFGYVMTAGGNQYFLKNEGTIGLADAKRDILGCSIVNVVDGLYSSNTSIDTWAEWVVSGDAQAVRIVGSPWLNPNLNTDLNRSSNAYALTPGTAPSVPASGVNGLRYSGHRGPWQYTPIAPTFRNR